MREKVMLRTTLLSMVCLASFVLLSGCPWLTPEEPHQFTSADSLSQSALFDGAMLADAPENGGNRNVTREVIEPDVIRRDGSLLYILNQYRGLTIVDLETQEILAQVPTLGFPRDLYLADDRAYVLVGYAADYYMDQELIRLDIGSRIYAVDIAEPDRAEIIGTFRLEGDFVDSRIVGDVLYAVSARYQWYWEDSVAVWNKQQTSESWVTSIDLYDPHNITVADELNLAGYGTVIHATPFALFVAAPDWHNDITTITYVDISDPAGTILTRGAVTVRGYVGDRFKMDAWNGVLRVVSNTSWRNRHVYVTTVDLSDPDALDVLGETSLEGAEDETLFATRFDGPLGYIVTFLIVDPLFVVDFSDPAVPTIMGILEVPGWSTHIEPHGDRLIALGVDDTGGRRVCVSLFDVGDSANPGLVDRLSFGDQWSWTTAYADVRAFTILDDLIIVPFSGWSEQGGYERLQFLTWDRDGLTLQGYVDLQGQTQRSFEYAGRIFAVTTEQLTTIDVRDLAAPVVTHRVTLAENVIDVHELISDLRAEIILSQNNRAVHVRTVDAAGTPLGTIGVNLDNCTATHAYGAKVILTSTGWDTTNGAHYRVVIVNCEAPANPEIAADVMVMVEPHWGWYWYYDILPVRAADADRATGTTGWAPNVGGKRIPAGMPWFWWPAGDTVFLVGNALVLRCSASEYDVQYGPAEPRQGLAVVNLDDGKWVRTIGLGYERIEGVNAANDTIYLSTKENAETDLTGRQFCAWYLHALDPRTPRMGPTVNVPGKFLQYDPATQVLVLEDQQYEGTALNWSTRRLLQSVSWDGGATVMPLDSLELPRDIGVLKARGPRIYFDSYSSAYVLGNITVAPSGALRFGARTPVTDAWAYLIDAGADSAYVVVNGSAVARYTFAGAPMLAEFHPVMNNPQRIRFGENAAYAPLGYAGFLTLER